jgi:DNA-binding CsgD family transcriptional regulator
VKDAAPLFDAIDAVYAAALDRFRWPESLGAIASPLGASVAMLLAPVRLAAPAQGRPFDSAQGRPEATGRAWHIFAATGLPEPLIDAYNTHWNSHDPFVAAGGRDAGGAFTVRTVHVDEHPGPFTNFFCEPAGCRSGLLALGGDGSGLAVAFWRPGDRRFGEREEEFLRTLWPHMVRARRIQETQWEAAASSGSSAEAVLDLWPMGVIGFSSEGRQVYANQAALGIAAAGDGLVLAVDGPVAAVPRETKALREAIRHVAEAAGAAPEWLRLSRPSGARPYEVAVCRVEHGGGEALAMMFVAAPDTPIVLDPMALRRLHGLTDLEVRIAECVVRGLPVQDMASSLNLTPQTTRWYVQQVRQKLEATSQSEIVRVLVRGVTGLSVRSTAATRQKN